MRDMDVVCNDNYGNYLVVFAKNTCIEIFAYMVIRTADQFFFQQRATCN